MKAGSEPLRFIKMPGAYDKFRIENKLELVGWIRRPPFEIGLCLGV